MLLVMLAIAESRRVQQYVRFMNAPLAPPRGRQAHSGIASQMWIRPLTSARLPSRIQVGALDNVGKDAKGREYLVTDPDFGPRFIASFLGFLIAGAIVSQNPAASKFVSSAYSNTVDALTDGAEGFALWGALGLLSSSCCALQLVLSFANVGCAGFNTVLGPVRPTFLALSAALQSLSWYSVAKSTDRVFALKVALPSLAVVLALSFLPEFLSFMRKAKVGNAKYDLAITVNDMGCTACAAKVDSILSADPRVLRHEVVFEESLLRLTVAPGNEDNEDKILADLCKRLTSSGYPSEPKRDSMET